MGTDKISYLFFGTRLTVSEDRLVEKSICHFTSPCWLVGFTSEYEFCQVSDKTVFENSQIHHFVLWLLSFCGIISILEKKKRISGHQGETCMVDLYFKVFLMAWVHSVTGYNMNKKVYLRMSAGIDKSWGFFIRVQDFRRLYMPINNSECACRKVFHNFS